MKSLGDGPRLASRTPKVAETVAVAIGDFILSRGLQEGDVLPNRRELIDSFGVTRGTIREALRLLETQGVVIVRPGPGGGPVVRQARPGDLANGMTRVPSSS